MLVALVALLAAPVGHGDPGTTEVDAAQGSSESASGHDPAGPGNSENAPGHDPAGPGNSENAPGHQAEQAASIEQSAGAAAEAEQDHVDNAHVTVRVDEPGNGTPITQENRAEADAAASADAQTSGPVAANQAAQADAEAAQSDVGNTVVTVRVGSPGDDAAVDQTNAAVASSSTSVAPPGGGASEAEESSTAAAGQDGVSNTSVSVRVFSPGDDGAVTQRNAAVAVAATSGAEGADAAATQDGVFNTAVSIRVESPGSSGAVVQESRATATAGSADSTDTVAVAVATTDGRDTALALAVDGDALEQPGAGGLQVWEWTWVWQHDESESLAALFGTAPTSWTWIWGTQGNPGERRGEVRSRAAREDEQAGGTWDWSWSWTREGVSDWTWQWDWQGTLDCRGCIWIWNWSWNWTGQPVAGSSTATPSAASAGPSTGGGQSNAAIAHAEASVAVDVAQTVTQGGDGEQFAGQIVDVLQIADAEALARQVDVASFAVGPGATAQANVVWSAATVALDGDLAQLVDQTMLVDGEATGSQWSGQEIELVQLGNAEASATQRHASLGGDGVHRASGRASVDGTADVEQSVTQEALAGGGTLEQWAGQLALVEQLNEAVSAVDQTGTPHSRLVGGAARASSGAGALATIDQSAEQHAARSAGVGSQSAAQAVFVGQDATASATTVQRAGGAALPAATSDATAANRALVVQDATQQALGSSAFDTQELVQQSIVVQSAVATSTSAGGIAGTAVVVNCAITQQTAGQSLAAGAATAPSADLSGFCFPPAPTDAPPAPQHDDASPTQSSGAGSVAAAAPDEALLAAPLGETGTARFHGRPSAKAPRARAIAQRDPAERPEPGGTRSASGSPSVTQVSVPPSPQARLDTRPGSTAGAGDAGREPPLPPAGDPPRWISALAAAAAGAGGSGIAAILLAFALVPPLLRRTLEGSVVRRPTDVVAQVEVPI